MGIPDSSTPQVAPERAGTPVFAVFCLLILGLVLAALFSTALADDAATERSMNVAFYLLAVQDTIWLVLAIIVYPLLWWLSARPAKEPRWSATPASVLPVAFGVLVSVYIGTDVVYHDFALSMDEFMVRWHSRLLQSGYFLAPAPAEWLDLSQALRPGFLIFDPEHQFWAPGYRPGTALLHAGLATLGADGALNAMLCAGSVIVLWQIARRLSPQAPTAVLCTVFLFASAPQFLVTGLSTYTMTAHLFASLLWLLLFIMDRPITHASAIVLGCYALGLHHVHVHSFMALPFLLNLAFVQHRWRLFIAYAVPYALAGLAWIFWMDLAILFQDLPPKSQAAPAAVDGGLGFVAMAVSQGIDNHGAVDLIHWATNATRLVAWQNLAALPLIFLALLRIRTMPATMRLVAWSVATSLIPYILLMPAQGHGWGYRYLHHCLGSLALLAGHGWSVAASEHRPRLLRFAVMLGAFSCLVALPLRAVQTEAVIRPFAKTVALLDAQPAEIVLIGTEDIWYGRDLVRNDPLLRNRPLILSLDHIPDTRLAELCTSHTVRYVDRDTLVRSGMLIRPDDAGTHLRRPARNLERLQRAGCPS